jgi:serine/threonine-protein kinase
MGAVYEATHSIIPRRVAIKVLRREFAVDSALVQRFFNEARATHAIRHPNIVEIIDVGMLPDNVPYLIMELLEGESLAERVARQGKLELSTALDFTAQVAHALQMAHSAGIIHRDIKPDHLFLVKDERMPDREMVKVLDFGIAKLRTDLSAGKVTTNAGTILGTPAYMSPEQCRGIAEVVDHRADVYGLGITLYELLCGQPPFIGRGIGEVMMLHMGVEPEPPSRRRSEVPPELDRIVLKALAKAPEARFQSMAEFAEALRGSLSPDHPGAVRPARNSTPSNLSVFTPASKKKSWLRPAALLAVGGLTLLALGGQALLRQNGSRPVAAKEDDSLERKNLRLRRDGVAAAPGVAAAGSAMAPLASAALPAAAAGPATPVGAASAAAGSHASGFLSLDSVPWANVYVGNRMLGVTPLDRVPLPTGRHELRLENPELEASTAYVVQIESGRLVSRFVDWDAKRGAPLPPN